MSHLIQNVTLRSNKIGLQNQCGATLITSVIFTSKILFYIANVSEQFAKKKTSKCQDFYKFEHGLTPTEGVFVILSSQKNSKSSKFMKIWA